MFCLQRHNLNARSVPNKNGARQAGVICPSCAVCADLHRRPGVYARLRGSRGSIITTASPIGQHVDRAPGAPAKCRRADKWRRLFFLKNADRQTVCTSALAADRLLYAV